MSGISFLYIIFVAVMAIGALTVFFMADAQSRYRKEVAEQYRRAYQPVDTSELSNRVHEYCSDEMNLAAIRRKLYLGQLKETGRAVIAIEIDRREEYLAKHGIYDEQVNNFIHLIKADLQQLNGMS